MAFTEQQMYRYARHIVLPEIGGVGQSRLLDAKVLLVGAGGLGSPLVMYLAAAGVGTLGIVDHDRVELANLHRQIAHPTGQIGMAKTESATITAHALNPETVIRAHQLKIAPDNAAEVIEPYDLVADGTDNFATRDVVHAACLRLGKTLVSAAVQGIEGQLTTFKAHLAHHELDPEGDAGLQQLLEAGHPARPIARIERRTVGDAGLSELGRDRQCGPAGTTGIVPGEQRPDRGEGDEQGRGPCQGRRRARDRKGVVGPIEGPAQQQDAQALTPGQDRLHRRDGRRTPGSRAAAGCGSCGSGDRAHHRAGWCRTGSRRAPGSP